MKVFDQLVLGSSGIRGLRLFLSLTFRSTRSGFFDNSRRELVLLLMAVPWRGIDEFAGLEVDLRLILLAEARIGVSRATVQRI
jgi:hypothetical protein